METKIYWVGDRPSGQWTFSILNQTTGAPVDLQPYGQANMKMLDSDNREVVFPDNNTLITNSVLGEVTFYWPTESVFTSPGRYVMQIELVGDTAVRRTSVQEILVRKLGGLIK